MHFLPTAPIPARAEIRAAPDKPYEARRGSQMRVGTTTRDATREEEERLYQASGRVRCGLKPVSGATLETLDRRRLNDYFVHVLKGDAPPDDDWEQWRRRLYNLELAMAASGQATGTVVGMRSGFRYARNQTLVNVMRDYDYVDARGMGVRNKKI